MPVMLTLMAHVRDWKQLQAISRDTLIQQAREAGARHYQIYRNTQDASELLIVAEFPDREAACELSKSLHEQLTSLPGASGSDDRFWEPCGWESIGLAGNETNR